MATNLRFVKEYEATNPVSEILCTDAFVSGFDIYAVYIAKSDATVQTYSYIRLLDSSNNVISASEYAYAEQDLGANGGRGTAKHNSSTAWANVDITGTQTEKGVGHIFYIFNPESSSDYTYAIGQSSGYTSVGYGSKWIGSHYSREQIKGFRYYRGSGNFDSVKIQVFGVL